MTVTTDKAATLPVDSIEDSIAAFKKGEFIIVLDSPHRENEGDLIIAADAMTASKMAFLIRWSSGIVCVPISGARSDALRLPQMVPADANADPNGTAYTVSVDAAHADVSTGVSAADRALVCRLLANPPPENSTTTGGGSGGGGGAAAFRRPGHVFPLRARDGGVLERQGHTEAALDFCRLSGRAEAGVIAELVDDGVPVVVAGDGGGGVVAAEYAGAGMMRGPACVDFARKWGLKICTIEDLVAYRLRTEGKANGA